MSRRARATGRAATSPQNESEGMGLGFFIANRLLERSGATITLANRPPPEHGAQVHVSWPREALEAVGRSQ
jgi:two-component system, sensor histidine kinase RegB